MGLSMERAFFHFAKHKFFLSENQILSNMHKITHLPGLAIHGSDDFICAKKQAELLCQNWENCKLWIVKDAGHAPLQPEFASAITQAVKLMAEELWPKYLMTTP